MTLKEIQKRHSGSFAIVFPKTREEISNRVVGWGVLQTTRQPEKLKGLVEYYEVEGFDGVTPVPCFPEGDIKTDMPPAMWAAFFRSYLGYS